MKKEIRLLFSKILLIPLVITIVGCGGGSSNTVTVSNEPNIDTENNDSERPIFLFRDVTIAPSATPTGDISDTTPTFTWPAIQNASEYKFGHEQLNNSESWRSYTLSAEDLNCITIEDSCSNTPTDYTFEVGEQRAWWVRAKIDGAWAEWSDPHVFTIIQNPTSIGIPNSITPTGNIIDTTPEFLWSAVQDTTIYQLGHEDLDTQAWQQYLVTKEQAGCLTIDQTCAFTPADQSFEVDQRVGWWVRAKINENWGEWSIVSKFTIIPETTNTIPQLFSPSGLINTSTPEFSWTMIEGATEYIFEHEESETSINSQEYAITPTQANCQNTNTNCIYTLPENTFTAGDDINWKVRSVVDGNPQEWSSVSNFTIFQDPSPIGVPNSITPTGNITETIPQFSWSSVQNTFEYQLGHEDLDTSDWKEYSVTNEQAGCLVTGQTCTFIPENLSFEVGNRIGWWVRAKIDGTWGDWSIVSKFTIIQETDPQLNVIINEILAVNSRTNLDPDFHEFSDWIELYNPTSQSINISNFGLSDDEDPMQWQFPEGTIIHANSYLLVWADDEDTQANALHANFKLSAKGENLTLADSDGLVIDNIEFDTQENDISTTKKLTELVFMAPTPGSQNGTTTASSDLSKAPTFTYDSGFFDSAITVALSQENGADIYFTTDGSSPNTSSQKYTQAINISETTIIRAMSLETGGLPSNIVSNSYFINHTSNLPVVSLTIDPAYLFDPKTGIYTEGDGTNGVPLLQCNSSNTVPLNYAQEWERPAHLEFFGNTLESEFSLTSGISISGQCSRANQKKSFSFELDSKFGTKKLEFKLFENKDVNEFKDFKLRTGSLGYELNDLLAATLTHTGNLNIDYQGYRATQMFVNGEYWGLYNFREKKGADYIVSNYPDIDKDELDIINQGYEAKSGDTDDYLALEVLLNTELGLNLSNDEDYQRIIGMIDESNYIDYMSLMIYSANTDWIGINQRSWKEKKAGAKWRWMIDDVDIGFYNAENANLNYFTTVNEFESSSANVMVSLFKALTKNPTFNQKFKSRFNTLLDTTFSPANMLNQINTIVDKRSAYIPLEEAKWSTITVFRFNRHVQRLKDFAASRTSVVRSQLDNFIPTVILE